MAAKPSKANQLTRIYQQPIKQGSLNFWSHYNMNRRKFIRQGCVACLSVTVISTFLGSCISTQYVAGKLAKDGVSVSKDDFKVKQKGGTAYSSFIIVRNDSLKYPVCLYRISDNEYR